MLDLSNVLATLLCIVLLQVLWSVYKLPVVRNFCSYVNHPTENLRGRSPLYIAWGIFILFTLCAAIASSYYFANRMSYMLTAHEVVLTSEINHDLLHLQYQFMIAAFRLIYHGNLAYDHLPVSFLQGIFKRTRRTDACHGAEDVS